jgi:chromatin segregation and condensation protein Rec8/ScpA/Scc1 (kleisin family)
MKKFAKTIYAGNYIYKKEVVYAPPSSSVTPAFLLGLIAQMSVRIPPKKATPPEIRVYKTISIKEVITTLTERIEKLLSCNFSDICVTSPDGDDKSTRVYTIISFLGMLELVRQGMIVANQNRLFGNIELQKSGTQIEEKMID